MSHDVSQVPIVRTKLHRPPVAGDFVPRLRLLERLEEGSARRLTLVSAPAGYGKSTLLSGWLAASELPFAWLSLDELDSDLRTFLAYFLAAVQTVVPDAGRKTRLLLDASELPPVRILASTLINELSEIDASFVLVLDDYHHIHDIAVHALLSELLRHRLEPLRLVVATRHDPALPIETLRGRGHVVEIRVDDLRFSMDETAAFLRNALTTAVNDEVVRILEERSEGWAAGLRLAALSLGDRPLDRERLLTALQADDRHAMEFLAKEVVERQPSTVRDYLLTSAVVSRFCGPLCDALYEEGGGSPEAFNGQRFIEWAARANLFVIPLDDEHKWYRFHHLFRRLLSRQLESRKSGEQIAALHARASAWYAENGLLEEALNHALEAGEPGLAGRIVAEQRRELMNREHWHRLHRLLGLLPAELVDGDPQLLIQKAWCAENRNQLDVMLAALDRAEPLLEALPQGSDTRSLRGEFDALASARSYYAADGVSANALAKSALERLPADEMSTRGFAAVVHILALQMIGRFGAARAFVDRELSRLTHPGSTYHARLFIGLAMAQLCEGVLSGVRDTATQLQGLAEKYGLPETGTFASHFHGVLHYYRNELLEVERRLAPISETSYAIDSIGATHDLFVLALAYQAQGRGDEAREQADAAVAWALEYRNSPLLRYAEAFRAELAFRQGRVAEAHHWAENFDPDPLMPGLRSYVPQLTLAKVIFARNTTDGRRQAIDLLARLEKYYATTHNTRVLIDVLALSALLLDSEGEPSTALLKLECAVVAAMRGGFIRPFLDLGPGAIPLLSRLPLDEEGTAYVGRIVSELGREAADRSAEALEASLVGAAAPADQPLAAPLSDRELEVLARLAERLSNKEIAKQMFLSPLTVKRHTLNIYQKLGVHGRREAVDKAASLGILSPD